MLTNSLAATPPIEDVQDWIHGMIIAYGRPTVEHGIEWSRAHLNEAIASTTNDDELSILNAQLDFYEEATRYLGMRP